MGDWASSLDDGMGTGGRQERRPDHTQDTGRVRRLLPCAFATIDPPVSSVVPGRGTVTVRSAGRHGAVTLKPGSVAAGGQVVDHYVGAMAPPVIFWRLLWMCPWVLRLTRLPFGLWGSDQ